MTLDLVALCFDARDPARLVRFWGELLGWDEAEGSQLVPDDDTGFRLRFRPSQSEKRAPNQMHFDLTSTSPGEQERTVARAVDLGARHIDVGQRAEEGHVVLGDPEGNELCVLPAGNAFLADCGFLGAVASDGTQSVGYFWSEALGWPLVWDQDQETAIRSPHGGPKITWGGPPVAPKPGRNRLRLEVTTAHPGDPAAEVERLVSLGATLLEDTPSGSGTIELADPDGNEFSLDPTAAAHPLGTLGRHGGDEGPPRRRRPA